MSSTARKLSRKQIPYKIEVAKTIERQSAYKVLFGAAALTLLNHWYKLILRKDRVENFTIITNQYMVKIGSDNLSEEDKRIYNSVVNCIVF